MQEAFLLVARIALTTYKKVMGEKG